MAGKGCPMRGGDKRHGMGMRMIHELYIGPAVVVKRRRPLVGGRGRWSVQTNWITIFIVRSQLTTQQEVGVGECEYSNESNAQLHLYCHPAEILMSGYRSWISGLGIVFPVDLTLVLEVYEGAKSESEVRFSRIQIKCSEISQSCWKFSNFFF